MNQIKECRVTNGMDRDGNPAGGSVHGTGLTIKWQDGPLGHGEDRKEPNGTFVETVISSAKQRLEFYQRASHGKFACRENELAIKKLEEALAFLEQRTSDREAREVEGTHAV